MLKPLPSWRRLLLIRWGGLGDLVLCSAVLEDLRRLLPEAHITLEVEAPWHGLFQHDPRLDAVRTVALRQRGRQLRQHLAWWCWFARQNFDGVLDLQCSDHSRLLLSGVRLLRPSCALHGTSNGWPYHGRVPEIDRSGPALAIYRAPLRPWVQAPAMPGLPISDAARSEARERIHGLRPPYLLLVPGCSAHRPEKRWPLALWRTLLAHCLRDFSGSILVLGAAAEAEVCCALTAEQGSRVRNLCEQTPLFMLPALGELACCAVAGDTGLAHLLATTVPLLGLYGPTDPAQVAPPGVHVQALQAPGDNLQALPVATVVQQLMPLIRQG